MKKKGFTLVELLAVIVVLAIIALIAVPTILGMVRKARIGAFKDSVLNAYDALEYTLQKKGYGQIPDEGISIDEIEMKSDLIEGLFKRNENGEDIAYFIRNKYFCAYGTMDDLLVTEECSDLDVTYPEIDETKLTTTSKTNSIRVVIGEGLAEDTESGIKSYLIELYLEDQFIAKKEITNPGDVLFEKLQKDTVYKVKVTITNRKGMELNLERDVRTKNMNGATFVYVNNPTESQNGYLKTQTVKVIYDSENIENPQYFLKTTRKAKSNIEVTQSCGTENSYGECKSIDAITTLEANVWYKVDGNIELTYDEASQDWGDITTVSFDGVNEVITNGVVHKIDTTSPEIAINSVAKKTNTVVLAYELTDTESGVSNPTCKYGEEDGNYTTDGTTVTKDSCILTDLTTDKEYYYQICVDDNVGNSSCKTGSTKTELIVNPGITLVNSGLEKNGFVEEQVAEVVFDKTNVESPQYFIKTTRIGTSSLNVTESCGTDTVPGECSTITSTKTLSANVWYKVSGDVKVTYNEAANQNDTIYALTYDGTNYSGAATGIISKIFYQASDVTYTNSEDSSIANVEDALDYLYDEMN